MIVAAASHWAFEGTGLSNGNVLPGLLGYEVDQMNEFRARKLHMNITALFETPLINRWNNTIHAHATIYNVASGANVFSSGTIYWSWGLDDYGVTQKLRTSRLSRAADIITWNLFMAAGIRHS